MINNGYLYVVVDLLHPVVIVHVYLEYESLNSHLFVGRWGEGLVLLIAVYLIWPACNAIETGQTKFLPIVLKN